LSGSGDIEGNSGTNPLNHFGTTDNNTLQFRINNGYAGKTHTNGTVAFGRGALTMTLRQT
jgi:hypothetical protein